MADIGRDEYNARLMLELERRKKADPMAFYETANDKMVDFHSSTAKTKALFGGNRSGKTEAALQELLWHLRGDHPYIQVAKPPVYWRVVVVDYNQVEKVINDKLRRMTPPSMLKGGTWEKTYNSRTHILTFANGSQVDIMTHEQPIAAFEGSARHGTLFDEEPPEDVYISCILRHVDYGGRTLMSMTPLSGLTWVYSKIYLRSFTDRSVRAWTLSIYENRFLTKAAIDEVENLVTDDVDRDIRLFGKFRSRTGLVFKSFEPDLHIYNPNSDRYSEWWDNEYPPADWVHIVGIDPGWGHPTGVLWLAINPESTDEYYYREHRQSEMLPEDHAEMIHSYNKEMGVINPIYVIDSQAKATDQKGGSVWKDYRDAGIIARSATKKLHDGNIKLARSMKKLVDPRGHEYSRFHVSESCPLFIEEIGEYQRVAATKMSDADRYLDKRNDLISAARYAKWEADKIDFDNYFEEREREAKRILPRRSPLHPNRIEKKPKRSGSPTTGY